MPKIKVCNHCGCTIPPRIYLSGHRRRLLYDFVSRHREGVTNRQIMEHVYADDSDGGPESTNIVCVMIGHINKILKPYSVAIRGNGGPHSLFRLLPL